MVFVKISFNEEERSMALKVQGHAGSAEQGKDLVCAAVSMLVYTVAQVVSVYWADGALEDEPTIELRSGHSEVKCKVCEERYAEMLVAFFTAECGFSLLYKNYPDYIRITPMK